jgi:DNA (cytosine-5)-methyltransferase 1
MTPRVAEFFAGIGLVRHAVEQENFSVVFANDIERSKASIYAANFDDEHFVLDDVRRVRGRDIPDADIATASFPCTDLSLAGNRVGLAGEQSGMFWEFARVIDEMGQRRPAAVLLENVIGFASSRGGRDMRDAIVRLNALGYCCDLFALDARRFVPQSRPRMFIVGSRDGVVGGDWSPTDLRPAWVGAFVAAHPELKMRAVPLQPPGFTSETLAAYVERISPASDRWWESARLDAFLSSLSPLQTVRVEEVRNAARLTWATAYRRTRHGRPVWEVRPDRISGCLRTARGGSSKQAVVEAGRGNVRVRWMMPVEYARLQGVPDFKLDGVGDVAALFGLGDAVCVPVIRWIARTYLRPMLDGQLFASSATAAHPAHLPEAPTIGPP